MCCFRKLIGILGTAALTVSLTAIEAAAEGTRRNSGAFATRLRAILDDGFGGRATLADLEARAAGARRLEPKAPAADYAVGLVLLKRMRNEQAADRFLDALKIDPT